jgi:putative transposase
MADFRLLVNVCLRHILVTGITSRGKISRFARTRAIETRVTGTIGLAAADVARSLASSHRRRLQLGRVSRVPYVRTLFVRIPEKSFHFDLARGKLRLSVRPGEWTSLVVPVSNYLRQALNRPDRRVTQIHIGLDRVVFVYAQTPPLPYIPTSLVALDTNESSLDGVEVAPEGANYVRISFPELREIQFRHVGRRQYLGSKKAHDRRVARRLLRKEGARERHRIRSRLHELTRSLIDRLAERRAILALEDLTGLPRPRGRSLKGVARRFGSRSFRRRLSNWPQGELHRQLLYKAQDRGVPIVWLNPYRTSRTCPRCGEVSEHRRRVGTRFDCAKCGWSLDRQLNAGVNLGLAALRRTVGLGGLRLDLDALPKDVVMPLYGLANDHSARVERTGREGVGSRGHPNG